jgi:hypothetical protein
MGANGFAAVLTISALLLALWLDLRLGERRPESPMRRLAHAFAAFVVFELCTSGFGYVARRWVGAPEQLTALFVLYLPGLVYAFLASLWLTRTPVDVARLTRQD